MLNSTMRAVDVVETAQWSEFLYGSYERSKLTMFLKWK